MAKKNLDALRNAEEEEQGKNNGKVINIGQVDVKKQDDTSDDNVSDSIKPNSLDGYRIIDNYDLPQNGELYPEHWMFAYRAPVANEVANFSTINEQDQPAILQAIEDLIRKCVVIWDTVKNQRISTGEVIDQHRTFFMVLLRDYYLPGQPVNYTSLCGLCHDPMAINLSYKSLVYKELKEKTLEAFDGRRFIFVFENGIEINFLVPTLNTSSKIFRYLMKTYKQNSSDREKMEEKIVYDKKFLLLAPYLFQTGAESIREIIGKFKEIEKKPEIMDKYIEIITKLKLDNFDYIYNTCEHCGSEEEAPLRFPGGWKELFVRSSSKYFD